MACSCYVKNVSYVSILYLSDITRSVADTVYVSTNITYIRMYLYIHVELSILDAFSSDIVHVRLPV